MFSNIENCRVCGNSELLEVLNLGKQSLTGVFPQVGSPEVLSGPVNLIKCCDDSGCGLVQLKQTYESSLMYGDNYGYKSSLNASMVEHLRGKVNEILDMSLLAPGDVVLNLFKSPVGEGHNDR